MITTWLAAGYADGSGSAMGRIALVAVAVLAVAAYAAAAAQGRDRAGPGPGGAGTIPGTGGRTRRSPGRGGRDTGVPYGNEESSRPDWRYGYPPGYEPYPLYDQARSPWAVRDDAISDRRSLAAPVGRPDSPAAFPSPVQAA